ncbi:MAG: hypothetical protein QHH43_08280 [Candidatus Saccharicenans sp.]|jgi:hypothetical protein|nr:hypothetical protein [Candidatus Saccharicenans sp.]MDH7575737.1 hypothetical protein [Candidatus Saccharicenans sp.]
MVKPPVYFQLIFPTDNGSLPGPGTHFLNLWLKKALDRNNPVVDAVRQKLHYFRLADNQFHIHKTISL